MTAFYFCPLHAVSLQFDFECRAHGANFLAYPPVVAGGNRANTLHYISNNQIVKVTCLTQPRFPHFTLICLSFTVIMTNYSSVFNSGMDCNDGNDLKQYG